MNLVMFVIDGKNKIVIVIIILFFIKFIIDFNICICIMFFKIEEKMFCILFKGIGNCF